MTPWRVAVRARVGALDLDLELAGDDRPVAVVGPNGSGKTTLLRLITGAQDPSAGEIVVGDRVLFRSRAQVAVPIEEREIGFVPQGYGLFSHLSVVDNVAFGLALGARRVPASERRRRAVAMLAELGCAELADRAIQGLSGGEQQRVALARALVLAPRMLLLDEPLAALDVSARRAVRLSLAARLREFGRPSIVVTHDPRDVVALEARVYVLDAGRVLQQGTLDELAALPANAFVAEFCDGFGSPT